MSGKSCVIAFEDSNLSKQLRKKVGKDDKKFIAYQTAVINPNDATQFDEAFTNWYKNKYKKEPSIEVKSAGLLADRVIEYYNKEIVKSAVANVLGNRQLDLQYASKYSNARDYEEGKVHCANIILNISKFLKDNGVVISRNTKDYYARQLKAKWNKIIFEAIANKTGKKVQEIEDDYNNADDKYSYIDKAFGKEKNINERNLLAVYSELNGTPERLNEYIDEVFANQKLNAIRGEIKGEKIDINEELALDAEDTEGTNNEERNGSSDSLDDSLTQLSNHIGTYSNWIKHISVRIKEYFDTLPKLTTPSKIKGQYDVDKNNNFGIANTMDSNSCFNMLYSTVDFSNKSTMIAGIRRIGETVVGYEAFTKVADDLETDKDFATEMFSVFAKTIIDKLETVVQNGTSKTVISNERASKEGAMLFDAINGLRSSISTIDSDFLSVRQSEIARAIRQTLRSTITDNRYNVLLNDTIGLIRQIFTSITEDAIISFVDNNNGANSNIKQKINNINYLITLIKPTINEIKNSQQLYASKQVRYNQAVSYNNAIRNDEETTGRLHDRSEYIDIDAIAGEDFLSDKQLTEASKLIKTLKDYATVNVSLNSRNVYGNLSSDIINNSFITRFTKLFRGFHTQYNEDGTSQLRNEALERWGRQKFRTSQYEYSNILLEHIDENGNLINKGLFRKIGEEYQLTEYAENLLATYLFNGASNMDANNNATYNKMNSGDYLPTTYINFFKDKDSSFGHYFLRIPSDAPKTFAIRAPRYNTQNLYRVLDDESLTSTASTIADNYDKITIQDYQKDYQVETPLEIKKDNRGSIKDQIVKAIVNEGDFYIPDLRNTKTNEDTNETYVTLAVPVGENKYSLYVLKGELVRKGKAHFLNNRELVGVVSQQGDLGISDNIRRDVIEYYKTALSNRDVTYKGVTYNQFERKINTEHPVFKILVNDFKQELIDAAVALNHYFEFNADGSIKFSNGKPVFKKGASNDRGYKFYHLGSNGTVLDSFKSDGRTMYKLAGKVFSSNKFTLNTIVDGKVVPRNYLAEIFSNERQENVEDKGLIHLLYGGRETGNITMVKETTKNANGEVIEKVTDVILNQEQQEKVNQLLSEYLEEYCKQAINKVNQYKDFMVDCNTNIDSIVNFGVNQLVTHLAYDDLFEGGTKFYQDSQTILKRAKEIQGSGVPYGIADYNLEDNQEIRDIEDSYISTGTYKGEKIQDIFKGTELDGLTQRTGFKAVTIKNSITTNVEGLKTLREKLIKDSKLPAESVDNLLYGPIQLDKNGNIQYEDKDKTTPKRRGGFTDTKVNDAQSYITFKEWVRRIAARGQLKRYMPLIQKLLNPASVLTAKDLSEFVQVQKNFYFDLHYDEEFNTEVPRQIKNAEFVLVPRLIKGTQLERVAQMMNEAGIDQLNTVETSKASNKDILTLWDNEGNISEERYRNFTGEAKLAASNYYYNYLYTQQETQQHVNDENKAGIQIVKKIIDNLAKGNPNAEKFFGNYIGNIEETYRNLLNEFQIPVDEDGNIILDEDGNIPNIDKTVFYDRLKEELLRTGINSNLLDYVSLDPELNEPIAPPISNLVLSKFETTVQSIFNNRITRQRLPGFHAAQVTNIGWTRLDNGQSSYILKKDSSKEISVEEYKALPKEEQAKYRNKLVEYDGSLRYHPNGQGYIEVKLPYSALGINKNDPHYKGMTNQEILEELSKEGLDEVIGYRIPTEGKQSICVMKVVDFLDDALGSTIVVPNDWVSQTGSDFDIDSVYGIQYNTYKKADGQIYKPKHVTSDNVSLFDWFNYIEHFGDGVNREKIGGKIKKALEEIQAESDATFKQLQNFENEAFSSLMDSLGNVAKIIKKQFQDRANLISKANPNTSGREVYIKQLRDYKILATALSKKKVNDAQKNAINKYIKTVDDLLNFLENQEEEFVKNKDNAITQLYNSKIDKYNAIAKESGLLTFDEYFDAFDSTIYINQIDRISALSKLNIRADRDNQILEAMISILKDPANLEENLSRSNFDKITEALNNILSDNFKTERKNRSPYNVFDEVSYQEEAMSGAELKAFSVTLDTFCSICNVSKPILNEPIKVVYNDTYNRKEISKRYKTKKTLHGFTITHEQYGWSSDNRNIEGMILTSYSSQTTAYILDAIKEGAIPNVNQYSFSAFKTLINLGIDYNTAIAFITSPAISRIIHNNMRFNSIYSNRRGNPIEESIREIAKELGIKVEDKTPVTSILSSIQSKYKDIINKIFKVDDEDINFSLSRKKSAAIAINISKLKNRINEQGEFSNTTPVEERLIFDLGNILIFNRLHSIANEVGDIARCCNPDKFGAKQTVFATDEVFNNIQSILYDEDRGIKVKKDSLLSVGDKHLLEAIYPNCADGIRGILKSNIAQSVYPSLAAFIKYASATSSVISKQVLPTQHPVFVSLCRGLASVFSGINPKVDEATYKDFQSYALTYIYNQVPTIIRPIDFIINEDGTYSRKINTNKSALAETQRIYGYGLPNSLQVITERKETDLKGNTRTRRILSDVEIQNPNHPTNEELNNFAKFSPAQKVEWIKRNFDEPGIFEFINVELFNGSSRGWRKGMQTIEFIEDSVNPNIAFDLFYAAYYNENPLVAMTAFDIIKYAVQVEGLRMRQRGVSKIIDNQPFIDSFEHGGTGFFNYALEQFGILNSTGSQFFSEESKNQLYEKYIRSHPDTKQIRSFRLNKYNIHKYNIGTRRYDMLVIDIPNDKTKTEEENNKAYTENLKSLGIRTYHPATETYTDNKYVRVYNDENKKTIIYKIKDLGNQIILYPLNPLNSNEVGEYTSNQANNPYKHPTTYEAIISEYAKVQAKQTFTSQWIKDLVEAKKKEDNNFVKAFVAPRDYSRLAESKQFNLDVEAQKGGSISVLKDIIERHFSISDDYLYVRNAGLGNFIFTDGMDYGVGQVVTFNNGTKKRIIISKVNTSKMNKKYLSHSKEENQQLIDKIENETLREVYTRANEQGLKQLSDVYTIIPDYSDNSSASVDGSMQSTLEESNYSVSEYARLDSARGNEFSMNLTNKFKMNGLNNTKTSMADNAEIATREIASYVTAKVNDIVYRFNNFIQDPSDPEHKISITNPRVQDLVSTNNNLLNEYMKLTNEAGALLKVLTIYDSIIDDGDSATIKKNIDDIHKQLTTLKELKIDEVERALARGWAAKISTNPLIKSNVLDILDGYYKIYGSMWRFHDIAENGNPLLQTILLDVSGDVEAKRLLTIRRKINYRKKIREFLDTAKKNGKSIDLSKFINDKGEFIADINDEGLKKYDALKEKKREMAARFGLGSIEHLRAKNEYDQFIAKHFNQKAKPEYYINKADNERIMIEQYPQLYSEYMKLWFRRNDLYRSYTGRSLPEEARKELEEINNKIRNLTRPGIYINEQGQYVQRIDKEENVTYTPEQEKELTLYSRKSQQILSNFINAQKGLRDKYFSYDPVYGFEEHLKRNLEIIASFEKRDANGVPTVPRNVLESNKEYVEARNWIRDNARFKITKNEEDGSLYARLTAAIQRLALIRSGKHAAVADEMRKANNGEGIRDEKGIPNGLLLTDKERAKIKQITENNYGTKDMPIGSDRILINSTGSHRTTIYTDAFYKGMSANKAKNSDYLAITGKINAIVEKYYSELDGVIHFDRIPDTEEGIAELNTLAQLYQQLRAIKQYTKGDGSNTDFIKENVEFVTDKDIYLAQANAAQQKSSDYFEAWKRVNLERDGNGNFIINKEGQMLANKFIYSYAKPKGKEGDVNYDNFVDKQRNEDLNLISQIYRKVPTRYYYQAMSEAQNNPDIDYATWYKENHVYNPYTRKYEPLECWTMNEIRDENVQDFEGEWVPNYAQRENKVRDGKTSIIVNGEEITTYDEAQDMRNHNWKEDLSLIDNYVKGSQHGEYDNHAQLNEYEVQMRDYLKDLLYNLAYTSTAKKFFERGHLPIEAKAPDTTPKLIAKELSKIVGFNISTNNGKEDYYNELGYEIDKTPLMPLTRVLSSSQISKATTIEEAETYLEANPDRTISFQVQRPSRSENLDGIELQEAIGRYDDVARKIREHNAKISQSLMNKDWYDVIEHFIDAAGHYNAVQENKDKLYYLLSMLEKQKHYMRKYGLSGDLKADERHITDDNKLVYEQTTDKDLIEQYKTYMRRFLFDQWKTPEGGATRLANNIQGFVSANYMMLNVRGGIANVNLGETAILGEAFAGTHFSKKNWAFGTEQWMSGVIGFGQGMYSEKAFNKQDAIAKFCKIVDYDEVTGNVRQASLSTWTERIRNFGYSPQTMGEHFMQNSVLFAMMDGHRIVPVNNDPRGIGYTIMSEDEYIATGINESLGEILTEEQIKELNEEIAKVKEDANKLKDYAWWRKDPVSEYVATHCDKQQVNEYYSKRKELKKKLKEQFEQYQNIYDQVDLGQDGYMIFKDDTILGQLDKEQYNDVTKALDLFGRFIERVRKVNNKIHGVYNKLGAAEIEKTWWGSLVMQYHKHLPMGILKRYKARGFFSEFRGSPEKGMVQSIWDVLTLNARRIHREGAITQEECNALESFQNIIKSIIPFILELPTTWKIATDYDKANIRRNLGDVIGVLGALAANVALYAIGQDDDEGMLYNLAIYEMDRLGSEAFMYNPIGAVTEVKKLMSTPIAAQSVVTDLFQSMYQLTNMALYGDEYEGIYQSGRFAGESKLGVYLQRRIPIWNGIRNIIDIEENNKYYKVGTTGSTIFNYESIYDWFWNEQ